MDIAEIVASSVKMKASDIHLSSNNRPACRINGQVNFSTYRYLRKKT